METRLESHHLRASESRRPPLIALLATFCIVLAVLAIFYATLRDPRCVTLLAHSMHQQSIPLPSNCVQTTQPQTDNMASYLEDQRRKRGLTFKGWIICKPSDESAKATFGFVSDSHWLPSYVPGAYQFRRTVIILPYARPVPEGSPVAGEVTSVRWLEYASQISGQCEQKFSVWK